MAAKSMSSNLITRQGWGPNWWQMAILTAPGVHPSLAMGLERKTVIMLSSVIATDHTLLYLDTPDQNWYALPPLYCRKKTTHCRGNHVWSSSWYIWTLTLGETRVITRHLVIMERRKTNYCSLLSWHRLKSIHTSCTNNQCRKWSM